MRSTITPLFLVASTLTVAQTTFTQAMLTPALGAGQTLHSVDHVPAGPATANFNFNVGTLQLGASMQNEHLAPSGTPYASLFPNATHVNTQLNVRSSYAYQQITSAGIDYLGIAAPGISIVYSNPERVMTFPLAYNATWTDTWSAQMEASGMTITRSGTSTGRYNGHGTIVLPFGSFPAARIEFSQTFSDSYLGTNMGNYEVVTISYVHATSGLTLFNSNSLTIQYPGQSPTTTSSSVVADAGSVGIFERERAEIDAIVFPNPASDQATLRLGASHNGQVLVSIMDLSGRTVSTTPVFANGASTDVALDLQGLRSGMYMARMQAADGSVRTLPVSVQ